MTRGGVAPPASLWIFCSAEVSDAAAGGVNCGAEVSGVGIYGVGSPDEVPEWVFTA